MILFAVDLSEPSALTDAVAAFAERVGEPLTLLHVGTSLVGALPPTSLGGFDDAGLLLFDPAIRHELEEAEEHALARFARERFGPDRLARPVRLLSREGGAAATVLDEASRLGASFIAVGHRTRGLLDGFLSGSTAVSVVKHAPCPVVVFPVED